MSYHQLRRYIIFYENNLFLLIEDHMTHDHPLHEAGCEASIVHCNKRKGPAKRQP